MREILFRGKNIKGGQWIYGSYVQELNAIRTTCESTIAPMWRVREGTVGQLAGITDKHGRRIFEGDIVKQLFYDEDFVRDETRDCIYRIEFNKGSFCLAYDINNHTSYLSITDHACYADGVLFAHYEYEVIGNIYDDLELLKE